MHTTAFPSDYHDDDDDDDYNDDKCDDNDDQVVLSLSSSECTQLPRHLMTIMMTITMMMTMMPMMTFVMTTMIILMMMTIMTIMAIVKNIPPGRSQPFILGVHTTASPSPNAATNYGFALDYNQVSLFSYTSILHTPHWSGVGHLVVVFLLTKTRSCFLATFITVHRSVGGSFGCSFE